MINNKGLTLIEILIALAIFILSTLALYVFIDQNFKAQNFSLEQSTAINEARRGIETAVKELREAMPGDTGAYPIELADSHEIIFYADYDRDDAIERVRYFLDGSDFKKNVIEASGYPLAYSGEGDTIIISQYVRNNEVPVFTYRDSDYIELTTPADANRVKLIHIYLKVNVAENRAPIDYELESDVYLRNLKENL